jgi:hypothetical protein
VWQTLKASKHILATLVILGHATGVMAFVQLLDRAGSSSYVLTGGQTAGALLGGPLPDAAWLFAGGYLTTVIPAALAAVGVSATRHSGRDYAVGRLMLPDAEQAARPPQTDRDR